MCKMLARRQLGQLEVAEPQEDQAAQRRTASVHSGEDPWKRKLCFQSTGLDASVAW